MDRFAPRRHAPPTAVAVAVGVVLSLSGMAVAHETRAKTLRAAREQKAQDIANGLIEPEGSGRIERIANHIEEGPYLGWFAEDFAGFHPLIGDLATGSGLALGLAYAYPFVESDAFIHASASLSTNRYRRLLAETFLPSYGNFSVGLRARYRNYPEMLFFGLGTDTPKDDRTSYRLVDTGLQVEARYGFLPWLDGGLRVSGFTTEIAPGTHDDVPTTHELFDETTAPGLEAQPDYLTAQIFAEVDYRDVPANARQGGFYGAYLSRYQDLDLDRYSFDRLDLEATQLIPFFDKRRIVVLHARLAKTDPHPGHVVPFYLMPYLGGDDTVRGFYEYRFHDRNLIALNAEYRWESFAGLDMALFVDAGKVANRLDQIRFSDLKTSYGIGLRFSTRGTFVFRLDIGTGGGEGTRVFFKFSHAF